MRKSNRSSNFVLRAAVALSLVSFSAHAGDELKYFKVEGTQLKQLKRAFWERLWHSNAGFDSCVRRLYSNVELLKRPLAGEDFGILSFFKKAMTSEKPNTFPFLNSRGEAWTCAISNGYCMGMSSLARDLNLLLIYDPAQSIEKLPKFASTQEKSEYFEKILYDVWKNKQPAVIPGYPNLNAFAADPVIKNIFMSAVPENWGDHASIPQIALGVLAKSRRHIEEAEILEEIGHLKKARKNGYNPLMYLGGVEEGSPKLAKNIAASRDVRESVTETARKNLDQAPTQTEVESAIDEAKGGGLESARSLMATPKTIGDAFKGAKDADFTYIHVVQVTKVKELGPRKWEITAIDPNGSAPKNIGVLHVDLDAEQSIYFNGASASLELNSFGQLPGDREHMAEIVTNVLGYAKTHPNIFEARK